MEHILKSCSFFLHTVSCGSLFCFLLCYCLGARKVASVSNGTGSKDTIASLLASLMEVVRTTVACECVYVRAMVIKALIWMQSPHESFDELESIIASELSDPGLASNPVK